jgi:hypothetical protein
MENTYSNSSHLDLLRSSYRDLGKPCLWQGGRTRRRLGMNCLLAAVWAVAGALVWQGMVWTLPAAVTVVRLPPPPPRVSVKPSTSGNAKVKSSGGSQKRSGGQRAPKNQGRAHKQTSTEQRKKGGRSVGDTSVGNATNRAETTRPLAVPRGARDTTVPGGVTTYRMPDGRQWELDGERSKTRFSKPGMDATFLPDGKIRTASLTRRDGTTILLNHTSGGVRTVAITEPSGARLVSLGSRSGYIQHPVGSGFVARTYVNGGGTSVAVYRPMMYGGATYYAYVPSFYYTPAFYGWAYGSWMPPVAFSWGWGGDPWFTYFGGYFGPTSFYPNAALWVTDFLLAQDLMSAYSRHSGQVEGVSSVSVAESTDGPSAGAISPLVKSAIADEVRQEFMTEQIEAAWRSNPIRSGDALPALDPSQRVFVVSSDMRVGTDASACALSPGDIIARTGTSITDDSEIAVVVMSSKPGDCPVDSAAAVDLAALQEMHNQFRQGIDAGLAELTRNQGRRGLPTVSAEVMVKLPGPAGAVRPDPDAERQLRKGLKVADNTEDDIMRASAAH